MTPIQSPNASGKTNHETTARKYGLLINGLWTRFAHSGATQSICACSTGRWQPSRMYSFRVAPIPPQEGKVRFDPRSMGVPVPDKAPCGSIESRAMSDGHEIEPWASLKWHIGCHLACDGAQVPCARVHLGQDADYSRTLYAFRNGLSRAARLITGRSSWLSFAQPSRPRDSSLVTFIPTRASGTPIGRARPFDRV
jgi:hypothetical protein